jgi:hypothetical protein
LAGSLLVSSLPVGTLHVGHCAILPGATSNA